MLFQCKKPRLMKILTLISAVVPFFIFMKFCLSDYQGNLLTPMKRQIGQRLQTLNATLEDKIKQIKFNTNVKRYSSNCQQILKQSSQISDETLTLDSELLNRICSGNNLNVFPQRLIITYMGQKSLIQSAQSQILSVYSQLKDIVPSELSIETSQLYPAQLPPHLSDKLQKQAYKQQIGEQLLSTSHMRHCLFTYKKCENYVIILIPDNREWAGLSQGFYNYQNVHFINVNAINQNILYILGMDIFSEMKDPIKQWKQWVDLRTLNSIHRDIIYLGKQLESSKYSISRQDIDEYIQSVGHYLNNEPSATIPTTIMYDDKFGKTNIFPSQYKLGVLLPLVVSFILFPFFNLMKAKMQ